MFSGMKPSKDADFLFFHTFYNRTENLNLYSNSLCFPEWKHLIFHKKQGTEIDWQVATALTTGQGQKTTTLWPMCYGSAECEPNILCAAVKVNTGV